MFKNNKLLKTMALAIPMTVAGIHAAAINAAPAIDNYWKAAPTTTAWVNPYRECWQGVEGEKLNPCGEPAPAPAPAPLALHLQFQVNRYQLQDIINPGELIKLDDLISQLKASPQPEAVSIVGHTDKLGSLPLNLKLSENRAQTIKRYMIDHGYPASLITSVQGVAWEGQDESDLGPLANNPMRRRVVVSVL
jgi:OOP family OmpA-OmpF porin